MFAEVDPVGNSPLDRRLKAYSIAWEKFVTSLGEGGAWLGTLPPTALGWKVADRASFNRTLATLSDSSEQLHVGTVNGRKIASIVVPKPLEGDIHIIKLMERRRGSNDPIGLDHVDFLLADSLEAAAKRLDKAKIPYTPEANDIHRWLSLRFGEDGKHEAKLLDHLVLDVAVEEMRAAIVEIVKNTVR